MKAAIKILALVMLIFFFVPSFSTGCDYGEYNIHSDFDVLVQGENIDYGHYSSSYSGTYEDSRVSPGAIAGAQVYAALVIVSVLMAALPGTFFFKDNNVVQGGCACAAGAIGFIGQTGLLSNLNRATSRHIIVPEGTHYFIIMISVTIFVLGLCQALIKKKPEGYQQPVMMYSPQPMMYPPQYQVPPVTMVPVPMSQPQTQSTTVPAPAQPQQTVETWKCYACGSNNPVTSGFCGNCGTKRGQ